MRDEQSQEYVRFMASFSLSDWTPQIEDTLDSYPRVRSMFEELGMLMLTMMMIFFSVLSSSFFVSLLLILRLILPPFFSPPGTVLFRIF